MDKLIIQGGSALQGTIPISGSKNASLPILAATIMCPNKNILCNLPHLKDVTTMINMINCMGAKIVIHDNFNVEIDTSTISNFKAEYELVKTMRASILLLGPMLTTFGQAEISLPGGCNIGERPIEMHLDALCKMGATIKFDHEKIIATAPAQGLRGEDITFRDTTVTGTENIMMAATLAQGKSILRNAACEPEIVSLAKYLNLMGAKISGHGTNTITIDGVKSLYPHKYSIISDRVEAGTYLSAAIGTKGQVTITNIQATTLTSVLNTMSEIGAHITTTDNSISLDMRAREIKPFHIKTSSYPGFPTDMQSQFAPIAAIANGTSTIQETIFGDRFMYLNELKLMGARESVTNNIATIIGQKQLYGASVTATDLRASASLVIAALAATGETIIHHVHHIDRGYEFVEEKLQHLGATIKRLA